MFYLRTVESKIYKNQKLGDEYNFIDRNDSYEIFTEVYELAFGEKHVADLDPKSTDVSKDVFGFLVYGTTIKPLYRENKYYVMTESGKTFEKLG